MFWEMTPDLVQALSEVNIDSNFTSFGWIWLGYVRLGKFILFLFNTFSFSIIFYYAKIR